MKKVDLKKDFVVFILTHGRVDNQYTYCSLCKQGYTGRCVFVLDNDILEKKAMYIVDMKKCETPCRLSGSNYWLKHRKEERDEVFV